MRKELGQSIEFLKKISPHDKEVILVAPIFFWEKHNRLAIHDGNFKPELPEVDFNDPILILRTGFSLHRQTGSDIEGDAPGKIAEAIINHPSRNTLFSHLENEEIERICYTLEEAFEYDELLARYDCTSLYADVSPEEFAVARAYEMLWERNKSLNIRWFNIPEALIRKSIVEAIIIDKLGRKNLGLISSGETPK